MLFKLLAAALSGLLLAIALPKFNIAYCLWIGLIPLLWALQGTSGRKAFLVGLINGLAQNLGTLYWIMYVTVVYGKLPAPVGGIILLLLAAYISLYRGLWAWLYTWGETRGLAGYWWGPALWVSLEFVQTYMFSGFPWMLLGYGLHQSPYLIQVVDITGTYGLAALIVMVNIGLYQLLQGWAVGRARFRPLAISLVFLGIALGYGYFRLPQVQQQMAQSPTAKLSVVQGNIEQGRKWDPHYQGETINIYGELTRKSSIRQPQVIVWPETAAPFFFLRDKELSARLINIARQNGSYLFFGSPAFEFGPAGEFFFNRAYLLSPDGEVVGSYDKAHLVPYGEYVPLRRLFPFIGKMVPMVGDFKEGPPGVVLALPQVNLGSLICFESIFPYLSRAMVRNGANVLVNITNDAWFGRTSAPYQHLAMAVVRAVENRVALARAANTGVSALATPDGGILWTSELYTTAAHTAALPLLSGGSFYTRYGDIFSWSAIGLTILGLASGLALGRRRR
ncbi:apolipoprotein N-acyltransferase [Desulfobacca acetoxidans]